MDRDTVRSRDIGAWMELLNGVGGSTPCRRRARGTCVAGLRRKLKPNPHVPRDLLALHGLGYKFVG